MNLSVSSFSNRSDFPSEEIPHQHCGGAFLTSQSPWDRTYWCSCTLTVAGWISEPYWTPTAGNRGESVTSNVTVISCNLHTGLGWGLLFYFTYKFNPCFCVRKRNYRWRVLFLWCIALWFPWNKALYFLGIKDRQVLCSSRSLKAIRDTHQCFLAVCSPWVWYFLAVFASLWSSFCYSLKPS